MHHTRVMRLLLLLLLQCVWVLADWKYANPKLYPDVPSSGPRPNPQYMVDNTHNYYHVAPDKGKQNGPLWAYSGSFQNYMSNLHDGKIIRGGRRNQTGTTMTTFNASTASKRQDSSYWLTSLGPLGSQPLAESDYKFWRNVVDDYGADNSGGSDAAEAINAAVSDGNRCGEECGNTFTQGAIIYFPPGTYQICSPIIQLYYTQFIGDANDPPTIQGCPTFTGIGLIDTDPYIPGGSGSQWFVNQNQFFRQIRNFIFDLTKMPSATDDNDQPLVPTGIHWQVAQATTLQNLVFNMPTDDDTTAVGIFSENGSGGFVSDLTFNGGNIGWRAGSQQYTARNLKFNDCLTAVQMVWDWGWTWQGIEISGGAIGFNISGVGGSTGQGIGSVSIIDSTFSDVPVGILTNGLSTAPDIVLDNVVANNVDQMVQVDGGSTLLAGVGAVLWAAGKVYNGADGSLHTGDADAPLKATNLLTDGKLFVQSRPQYETYSASGFSVATTDGGCSNDGTGDQTNCINVFLQKAVSSGLIAYFPAGIYQVGGTVLIPTGSRVQGSSWSQIQAAGYYFSDMQNPKVVVQVGNAGDVGTMQIVEMLVTVRGNTAGAVLMEWNVAAEYQGAAAMWDTHFRVGGGTGTDLDVETCPKRSFNDQCIAATLMFHVTKQSSGYFENVWAWVADHDNDDSLFDNFDTTANQISIYGARGMLIESQGPSWFYGTSSEHSVLYNYQLSGAKDIYMGHIQTETPYYQPDPIAPAPFNVAASFANDPDFSHCNGDPSCAATWGLRVVDSSSVTIHGAGLYSFFQNYYQDCLATFDCQKRILEVTGSTDVVIFNLFTVATSDIAVGVDNTVVFQNDTNQRGFTTEDAIWLPIDGADNIDTIYVGTQIWPSPTVSCSSSSCLLVFPTSPLPSSSTISPSPYTTSFEYGGSSTVTVGGVVTVTFITTTTTTVITIPPVTIGGIPFSNYNITSGQSTIDVQPSVNLPPVTIGLPNGAGTTTSRVVPLPPWPDVNGGPPETVTTPDSTGGTTTYYSGLTSTVTVTGSTVITVSFPATIAPTTVSCPPQSTIIFATPAVTLTTDCPTPTTWAIGFDCPTTKVVTFLGSTTGQVSVDCTLVTVWTAAPTSTTSSTSTTTTPLPVWTTWPPGIIAPVTTTVTTPEPTSSGSKQPCTLWFFFICISHDDLHIGGWFWSFPPGIYPPGPPPPIEWPPGFTLKGSLPPWPKITIGPDLQLTYSQEPDDECTTKTASVCSATTSFFVTTTTDGETVTTSSSTVSDCETIYGCDVTDSETATETSTVAVCSVTPGARRARRDVEAHATQVPYIEYSARSDRRYNSHIQARAGDCVDKPVIVYPKDPQNVVSIIVDLAEDTNVQIQSTNLAYTAYFWVESLTQDTAAKLDNNPDILGYYDYVDWNTNSPDPGSPIFSLGQNDNRLAASLSGRSHDLHALDDISSRNGTTAEYSPREERRAAISAAPSPNFNEALVSLPPRVQYQNGLQGGVDANGNFIFYYDDSAGRGATVYAIGEVGCWTSHPEFQGAPFSPRMLTPQTSYGYDGVDNTILNHHTTTVAAAVEGISLGSCKACSVVYSGHPRPDPAGNYYNEPRDWYLEDLLSAWDDMNSGGRTPQSSVINISWGSKLGFFPLYFIRALYDILKRMDRAGVTIVVAAGNWGKTTDPTTSQLRTTIDTYPQLFASPGNPLASSVRDTSDSSDLGYLPNMIIVGAADRNGYKAAFSQDGDFLTTYAPGANIYTPSETAYEADSGTSYAAPEVAGLAAYFKQLPSQWQDQLNQANSNGPKAVKALIVALQRQITLKPNRFRPAGTSVSMVWNGMDTKVNCLLDYPSGGDPDGVCPGLPDDITTYTPPATCGSIEIPARALLLARENDTQLFERQAASCTIGGDSGDNSGGDVTITFTTGPTPGPTCVGGDSACGGVLCTGYWCAPTPTGSPPGYQDPKDPSSAGNTASQTTITSGFGQRTTSTTTTNKETTTTPTTTTSAKPTITTVVTTSTASATPTYPEVASLCIDDAVASATVGWYYCVDSSGYGMTCDECFGKDGTGGATTAEDKDGALCFIIRSVNSEGDADDQDQTACPGDPAPLTNPDGTPNEWIEDSVDAYCEAAGSNEIFEPVSWAACFAWSFTTDNDWQEIKNNIEELCDGYTEGFCTCLESGIVC